jgi:hypothetical protein
MWTSPRKQREDAREFRTKMFDMAEHDLGRKLTPKEMRDVVAQADDLAAKLARRSRRESA